MERSRSPPCIRANAAVRHRRIDTRPGFVNDFG
jgi:hypothetical protein